MTSKTTRFPVDLIEAAETEGRAEHRSAAKQLEHWARFGLFFDRQTSAVRVRIQQAITGKVPLGGLNDDEQIVANAAINADISVAANQMSFADRLAASGVTTVIMDKEGHLIRRSPDGSTQAL